MAAPNRRRQGSAGILPALLLALVAMGAGGCASLTAVDQDQAFSEPPRTVELEDVPYFPQEELQCGPAALAEVLSWTGQPATPEELKPALFIPAREGTLQAELVAQTRQRDRVPTIIEPTFDAMLAELHAGNPVLVFQNLGLGWWPVWHYAVVVGYDPEQQEFILRSGTEKRVLTSLDLFRRTWDRADRWAMVVTRPDQPAATATATGWLRGAVELEQTGRVEAAVEAYETGRDHWPEEAGFHLGLVNLLYAEGELELAAEAAETGIVADTARKGVLLNNLALIRAQQERWDEAEQAALSAVAEGGRFADTYEQTLRRVRCRGDDTCLQRAR
ncbi:MAG: PA2778 family cysteine peptidase [Ectothiorhodospiraceae bacterium]|nr:PA2778 family cysteine peptidase [Ectothiorhodospiraceae bacterium]